MDSITRTDKRTPIVVRQMCVKETAVGPSNVAKCTMPSAPDATFSSGRLTASRTLNEQKMRTFYLGSLHFIAPILLMFVLPAPKVLAQGVSWQHWSLEALPAGAVARLGDSRWHLSGEPTGVVVSPDGAILAVANGGALDFFDARAGTHKSTLGVLKRNSFRDSDRRTSATFRNRSRLSASGTLPTHIRNDVLTSKRGIGQSLLCL